MQRTLALIAAMTASNTLAGDCDGSYESAVNYAAGTSTRSATLGDVNGDGKLDLAITNFQNDNLGNGGVGGDPVLAMGQSSGGPCPNNEA